MIFLAVISTGIGNAYLIYCSQFNQQVHYRVLMLIARGLGIIQFIVSSTCVLDGIRRINKWD